MRRVVLIFLIFIPFCLFSQNEIIQETYLIKKDSTSFYSFNKKGVVEYVVLPSKELQKTYTKYTKPIPTELETVGFASLSSVVSKNGVVYFLYPGGGILFKYSNGLLERIDESFAHRNQFSGYFFEYNDELYLLGGYGYWKSNSLLTKFNFDSKGWEFVPSSGQTPPYGLNAGSYVLEKNSLYVFDFYHRLDDKDLKNNNLFVFNLDAFKWTKKGNLNNSFYNDILAKNFEIITEYKSSLFQKNLNDEFFRILSPSENKITFYSSDNLTNINNKAIIVGSNIIYPVLSADRKYQTLTVKDLAEITIINEEYLTNDLNLFKNYFIYVGLFCGLLILMTFLKFKKEKIVFFLSEDTFNGNNKTLSIDKDEKFVLELLCNSKGKKIDNSFVLNYFKNNTISKDASVKRKNKVIEELNRKAMEKFKIVLVIKQSSINDSRQVVYCLNPLIEI